MRGRTGRGGRVVVVLGLTWSLLVSTLGETADAAERQGPPPDAPPVPPGRPGPEPPLPGQPRVDPSDMDRGEQREPPGPVTVTVPAGSATTRVGPDGRAARAGSLPVSVATADKAFGAGLDATVEVLDPAVQTRLGSKALAFSVTLADPISRAAVTPGGRVTAEVDYSGLFDQISGWADRLSAMSMPACALVEPIVASCPAGTPLTVTNDVAGRRLHITLPDPPGKNGVAAGSDAERPVEPEGTTSTSVEDGPAADPPPDSSTDPEDGSELDVDGPSAGEGEALLAGSTVVVTSATAGSTGDYAATPLSNLSAWNVSAQSGSFNMSYTVPVPPAGVGATPDVTLTYSSAALDGFTADKNTQPSWVGQGWDLEPGYIERQYAPCNLDWARGDLCWAGQNFTIVLNGVRSRLVATDANYTSFRLQDDPGWRVEKSRYDGWNWNLRPDYYREDFVVTTPDGTQYWFGQDISPLTGQVNGSMYHVPVYSQHPGDPCYGHAFNLCQMPWRWNLDQVIDVNGNSRLYSYVNEVNWYNARGLGTTNQWPYVRAGHVSEIAYSITGNQPRARVLFATSWRCENTCSTAADWPDTPLDLRCFGQPGTGCPHVSPSFFSIERLHWCWRPGCLHTGRQGLMVICRQGWLVIGRGWASRRCRRVRVRRSRLVGRVVR